MHCYFHVFDGKHIEQNFDHLLKEYVAQKWLREVEVGVSAEMPSMLEVCAAAAVGSWVDGEAEVGDTDWMGVKMMDQLESIFWGIWLYMDD
jgi:hypothetical protein